MSFENVLLIQTAFIGDVVLTTPMIRALRKSLPNARITVLVRPDASVVIQPDPHIDEILVIDKKKKHKGLVGMMRLASQLRAKNFDLLLCPHMSHRSAFLSLLSRCPIRTGYRQAALSRLAYTIRLERDGTKPEIHRLLDFLRGSLSTVVDVAAAIQQEGDVPRLFETEDSAREAGLLLQDLQVKAPILVAPSSVWPTKRWTPYGFAELCAKLIENFGSDVLLVGSKEDSAVAQDVMNFVEETVPPLTAARVHNVCGKTSLTGLFSLMRRARLLVSNDSAPVHFGCAAGIPVTAIFGPTVTSLGYAPIAPRTIVAQKQLACRPCGTHGGKRCPLGHFQCMRTLSADEVMQAVRKVS